MHAGVMNSTGFASNPSPPPRPRPPDRVREETGCSATVGVVAGTATSVAAGVAAGVADVDVGVLVDARKSYRGGLTAVAS